MKPRISPMLRNISYTYLSKTTGYTRTHVRRILSGQNRASVESLAAIAGVLNTTLDELYWHIEAMRQERQLALLARAGKLTKTAVIRLERKSAHSAS